MFNEPKLTIAWILGGFIQLGFRKALKTKEQMPNLLASGLILGEGVIQLVLILGKLLVSKLPH